MLIMFKHEFLLDLQRSEARDAWQEILANDDCIGITRAVAVSGAINR